MHIYVPIPEEIINNENVAALYGFLICVLDAYCKLDINTVL